MCRYERERAEQHISDRLPSVGMAVCASCAIPGILDAVEYRGEFLYDGALSGDGQCPVEPAQRHFGARPDQIVAIDVGEDEIKKSRLLRLLWALSCGGRCDNIDGDHPDESKGTIVVKPIVTGFHALAFTLARHHKWRAILSGYRAFVARLEEAGLLDEKEHQATFELSELFGGLLASKLSKADFVRAMELVLSQHGLF